MSSHRAGLSSGAVMDRVSAKQDDTIKRRINCDAGFKRSLLARTPCHRVIARHYDGYD